MIRIEALCLSVGLLATRSASAAPFALFKKPPPPTRLTVKGEGDCNLGNGLREHIVFTGKTPLGGLTTNTSKEPQLALAEYMRILRGLTHSKAVPAFARRVMKRLGLTSEGWVYPTGLFEGPLTITAHEVNKRAKTRSIRGLLADGTSPFSVEHLAIPGKSNLLFTFDGPKKLEAYYQVKLFEDGRMQLHWKGPEGTRNLWISGPTFDLLENAFVTTSSTDVDYRLFNKILKSFR